MQISIDIPEEQTQETEFTVKAPNTSVLSLNVKILQYLGLSPLDGPSSWAHRIGRSCSIWVVVNAFYAGMIALPVEIYLVWDDKYRVRENLGHIAYCLFTASKLLTLMLQQNTIRSITDKFDQMYEREETGDEFQKNVLFTTKRISNFMTIFATVCSLANTTIVCVMGIAKALSTKRFFLRIPFPFDMDSFPGFPLTIIYWISSHIVTIGMNSVCDGLYIVLFFHGVAHYMILNHKMESYYEHAGTETNMQMNSLAPETPKQTTFIDRTNKIVRQQKTSRKLASTLSKLTEKIRQGIKFGRTRSSESRETIGTATSSGRSRGTLETRETGSNAGSGRLAIIGGHTETREHSSYRDGNSFNEDVDDTNIAYLVPDSIDTDYNEISCCTESNWRAVRRTLIPSYYARCISEFSPTVDRSKQNMHLEMKRLISENVKYHQEIEGQIAKIMDVFKYMLEVQVIINVLAVCACALVLAMNKEWDYRTLTMLFLCLALQVELIIFCYLAELVIEQSDRVRDSVYRSNWTIASKSNSRSLMITMCRANKPLELPAGRIALLSLVLFREWTRDKIKSMFDNFSKIQIELLPWSFETNSRLNSLVYIVKGLVAKMAFDYATTLGQL